MTEPLTSAKVKAYAEERQISLMEAKRILLARNEAERRARIKIDVMGATSVEDLKEAIIYLLGQS